jgi:hypothetical protein
MTGTNIFQTFHTPCIYLFIYFFWRNSMKNVLAIAALFAAATVGASAQYSTGTLGSGGGQHMFNEPGNPSFTSSTSGGSAAASIRTEVVQNASVHYLNTPINISSAMNVGTGDMPNTMTGGVEPTFFLIQGQTASFEDFRFEVRGSERARIDIDWSVTGNNNNVDLTAADAVITGQATTNSTGASVAGNAYAQGPHTVAFPEAPGQYDQTSGIDVNIDFSVEAINEPADDGFPGGAGDPTNTGTRFEVKVNISDYELVGNTNITI